MKRLYWNDGTFACTARHIGEAWKLKDILENQVKLGYMPIERLSITIS